VNALIEDDESVLREDCGVTYKGHGLKTQGKGKKAKTVAKSPGKVSYGKK